MAKLGFETAFVKNYRYAKFISASKLVLVYSKLAFRLVWKWGRAKQNYWWKKLQGRNLLKKTNHTLAVLFILFHVKQNSNHSAKPLTLWKKSILLCVLLEG